LCGVLVYLLLFFKGCVTIEDPQTVILNAPKESSAMKNSERGIGHSVHRFTFSQVGKLFSNLIIVWFSFPHCNAKNWILWYTIQCDFSSLNYMWWWYLP